MTDDNIAIYLNDHLAGSVAALDLLEQLQEETRRLEAARKALTR
jgi:hypothetical protein